MSGLRILIPCKPLAMGKSRLADVLAPAERRNLCASFLARTLDLAAALAPARDIAVIASDGDVATIAQARRAEYFPDGDRGLNASLSLGRDLLFRRRAKFAKLLILPIDLPFAMPAAIAALLSLDADVALAPDASRLGTNLLCLDARAAADFTFRYGHDSFRAHCRQAQEKDLQVKAVQDWRLATDIDRPEDYLTWMSRAADPSQKTGAFTGPPGGGVDVYA